MSMSTIIASSSLPPTDPKPPFLKSQTRNQRKLSVAEIERAIGAGIFRDRDTSRYPSFYSYLLNIPTISIFLVC